MKRQIGRVATTHEDLHGDQMTLSALVGAAKARDAFVIPVLLEHQRRLPPIGRGVSARVERLEDGHFALVSEFEVFEDGDDPASYADLGKPIFTPHAQLVSGAMWVGEGALSGDAWRDIVEIAKVLPLDEPPQRFVRKTAEITVGSVVIALGLFVIAQVSSGFLKKIGEDAYSKLKAKLGALYARPSAVKMNLEVVVVVVDAGQRCEVRVFFDAPVVDVPADGLLEAARLLEADLPTKLIAQRGVGQLTYRFERGSLEFLYGVFSSGVPFPFEKVRFAPPNMLGLSVGFTTTDGMEDEPCSTRF